MASYDPMETRKNFIRESVLVALNETGVKHWQRAVNVLEKRGKTGTEEYKKAKAKLRAAKDASEDRVNAIIGGVERQDERRAER